MATEHQVRVRAYQIWDDEGQQAGQAESHWLRAEAELTATIASPVVEVLATNSTGVASPAKTLKPAAKSAKSAKAPEPKLKAKRAPRAKAEHAPHH